MGNKAVEQRQRNWIFSSADQEWIFGNEHSDILKSVANLTSTYMLTKEI